VEVVKSGQLIGHKSSIYALTNGFEKGSLISSGGDGWIVSWNPGESMDGKLIAEVEEQVYCCAIWRDGSTILAGSMSGALYSISLKGEVPRKVIFHRKSIYDIWLGDDYFLTISGDGKLCKWSYELKPIESISLTPSGLRCIHCTSSGNIYIGGKDGYIYVLSEQLEHKSTFKAHAGAVFSLTTRRGLLISGGLDALLKIWDMENFRQKRTIQAHYFTINDIKYISNADIFATASRDKTVRLWESSDWELKKVIDRPKFEAHLGSVNALTYLEELNLLCSASDDNSVLLWQIKK